MKKSEFERILDLGIKRETEAHTFYQDVVEKFQDRALKQIFQDLADQELGHKTMLENFKINPDIQVKMSTPAVDFGLAETVDLPELSTDMTPAEALALAMKKEQQAVEFYRYLASYTNDEEVKQLILEMANMELAHKQILENAYTDVAYVESF